MATVPWPPSAQTLTIAYDPTGRDQSSFTVWLRSRAPVAPNGWPIATEPPLGRSEEHTSELQSLMRSSYAVFCLKKKKTTRYDLFIRTHMRETVVPSPIKHTHTTRPSQNT